MLVAFDFRGTFRLLLVFGAVAEDVHEQEASALDAIVVSIRPGALTVIERGP